MSIYDEYENFDAWAQAIGKELTEIRLQKEISYNTVAKDLGITCEKVYRMEYETQNANLISAMQYCRYLGMNVCTDIYEIGRRIAAARIYRNMTQRQLANKAGVSASEIQWIESRGGSPKLNTFCWICEALNIPIIIFLKSIEELERCFT